MTTYNDALIYSQIKNNVNFDVLDDSSWDGLLNNLNIDRGSNISSDLNNIISNTTIKRACCMRNSNNDDSFIDVRIPLPKDYVVTPDNKLWSDFGYIDKRVSVPQTKCDNNYVKGSTECDQFYKLYCENAKAFFIEENKGVFEQNKFASYKPECACYGPKPIFITGSVAPSCYLMGCDESSQKVYPDLLTRKGCNANFCTQNVDISKLSVGGNASVVSVLHNKCGDIISSDQLPISSLSPSINEQPLFPNISLPPINDQSQPSTIPSQSSSNSQSVQPSSNSQSTNKTNDSSMDVIKKYFSSEGNYMGIIILIIIILLICLSSIMMIS